MSSRLANVASIGSPYYDQQQHSMIASTASAASSQAATMHFQAATMESRLPEYRQPTELSGSSYPGRYPAYAAGYLHPAQTTYPYGPAEHPHSQANYAPPPSHPYYSSLMGASAAGLYGHRSRYMPYHPHAPQSLSHQHHQPVHGMFTPAGQQLIPSSVLHYPPRNNVYHQQQLQQQQRQQYAQQLQYPHQQQQQPAQPYRANLLDLRNDDLPFQQQVLSHIQQPPYVRAPQSSALNSYAVARSSYNPYGTAGSAREPHYQHAQQPISPSVRAAAAAGGETVPAHYSQSRSTLQTATCQMSPVKLSSTADAGNSGSADASELSVDRDQLEGCAIAQMNAGTDSLTTSPPLTSATGTDSGISSCSMRVRSDDSTRSTPVYSSEYPLSVGSCSSLSYHCGTEGKDSDEAAGREQDGAEAKQQLPSSEAQASNAEQTNAETKKVNDGEGDGDAGMQKPEGEQTQSKQTDIKNEGLSNTSSKTKAAASVKEQEPHARANNNGASSSAPHSGNNVSVRSVPSMLSTSASGADTTTNSSPKMNERCTTPFAHTLISHASQHQQKPQRRFTTQETQETKHFPTNNIKNNSSWSPFPSSPNSWMQQYSPKFKRQYCSPPPVPVPPHNSPVGYTFPTSASGPTATSKNRIIECDLIPNKKSKRRSSVVATVEEDVRKEIRDITPLPGFLQAFGSTEIGRFSETFLLTPLHNAAEEQPFDDCFTEEYAFGGYHNTAPWPIREAYEFGGPRNLGASKLNLQFDARSYAVHDYLAYERYYNYSNYGRGRGAIGGGFGEIRCNGY